MILAGDIGGTNTRLAIFDQQGGKPVMVASQTYASDEHESLRQIVQRFFDEQGNCNIDYACFGIAGPVEDGQSGIVNLSWGVDADDLSKAIGFKHVELLNDLAANAYGLIFLEKDDIYTLNEGDGDDDGHLAIISPGTGLGEAFMYYDGVSHRPIASEGGHGDFAPHEKIQADLLFYLMEEFGRVSWERVLSGPGLVNIFHFLRDRGDIKPGLQLPDSPEPAEITKAANQGDCPLCARTVEMFLRLLGAEAGNMALKVMAMGGVWIGGGIMAKIIHDLPDPQIITEQFLDKGRFEKVIKRIPLRVILNDQTALLGAARRAIELI